MVSTNPCSHYSPNRPATVTVLIVPVVYKLSNTPADTRSICVRTAIAVITSLAQRILSVVANNRLSS